MSPCLTKCCIWSQDALLMTLSQLIQPMQAGLWAGSRGRGGAPQGRWVSWQTGSSNREAELVQAAADRTGSWFQTKPLLNAIKVLLLVLKPFILSCFRLRRCLACSGPAFWWHNSRSALTWLVESSVMLKWILLTLKTLIQSKVRTCSECMLFLSCHQVIK